MKERYEALLRLTKELAAHAAEASMRASASAEQARLAGSEALVAAQDATAHGENRIAGSALAAARAAADAAAHAAEAAVKAWKAVLVATGHNADREVLAMSLNAWQASKAANASAEGATKSVAEAFEAMKSLTQSAWIQ